jgi:hypothetical protein
MASDSKVFVSPGVYTSEKDLSFVAQSVGVTTLGIAGETLKGPAFEPIFISSYGEFQTYFGGLSPEKFVGTQIPKYELSYIAKAYLQQSNQLFITRVLGYSGYDAGPSWSISTIGNVDCESIRDQCMSTLGTEFSAATCNTGTKWEGTTGTSATVVVGEFDTIYSGGSVFSDTAWADITATLPWPIQGKLDSTIFKTNGSETTLATELTSFFSAAVNTFGHPTTVITGCTATGLSGDSCFSAGTGTITGFTPFSTSCATGAVPCFFSLTGTPISYAWGCNYENSDGSAFAESSGGTLLSSYYPTFSGVTAPRLGSDCSDYCDDINDPWLYTFFDNPVGTDSYSGFALSVGVDLSNVVDISTSANTTLFSGITNYSYTLFTGKTYCNYDDMVVATLRSRGESTLSSGGPVYQVTGGTDVTMVCTGNTFGDIATNPFATFGINVTDVDGDTFRFETSMSPTNKNYLKRVFGTQPFDKDMEKVPVFVDEAYPNMLTYAYKKGYIKGLNCNLLDLPPYRDTINTNTIAFYQEQWQTPVTPYLVSELRGNKVYKLFRFISIADGNAANTAVKLSIINISLERKEFDILVRDYYDTDNAPTVLEKFTRCSMDINLNSFVGVKVGTANGEYELKSKYIMVDVDPEQELDVNRYDAVPCGFEGYITRQYASEQSPTLYYKTQYNTPGETIWNPPFALSSTADNATTSKGDNIRRVYLGISTSEPSAYDDDFFQYKGKQPASNTCTDLDGDDWGCITPGFHLDSGATCTNTLGELCVTTLCKNCGPSGTTTENQFSVGAASFRREPTDMSDPYYKIQSRKFTLAPYGGFDGWDIYRKYRTNSDQYIRGKSGFLNGACISTQFPNAKGDGSFKLLSQTPWGESGYFATTDYYAYYFGIRTFRNPEAVNINVFTTPGIDYVSNSNLIEETIDMVESERADSLYITTTPDYNMFVASSSDPNNIIQATEAVDNLDLTGIDSNYTATYYPWVQYNDQENNTRVWLPATYDVMRNIALTDNISFPWFASAGYTRGIVNAVKARKKLTLDERDTLYQGRINPIATYSDVGTIIWGNKTLQSRQSALDRINVRRLLLQARKLISAVAVKLLFEQNDEQVRNEFLDLVNPILDSIRRERGLTDFRVVLSDDPQLIDQNTLEGKIYIKPTRSLEFIDIEFLITPTGASFENV